MNKIKVDNITLNNSNLLIENQSINKIINDGQSELSLFNCNIIDLDIELNDNSNLIINIFNVINDINCNIKIKARENAKIIVNSSFKVLGNYNLNIITDFLNNNSMINLNLKGLNDGGYIIINVDGYVNKDKNDNYLDENLKIINLNNGKAISNPNMFINTSKVIANHNTTIGDIRKEELFYLMTNGIDKENAIKMISQGFLISHFDNEELIKKIKE